MLTKNSKKMTHTYIVTGMSCDGCRTKVEKTLNAIDGVQAVLLDPATATITMEKHIQLRNYKKHSTAAGKYSIEMSHPKEPSDKKKEEGGKSLLRQ
jgi:Cu2+-exporting ATPase